MFADLPSKAMEKNIISTPHVLANLWNYGDFNFCSFDECETLIVASNYTCMDPDEINHLFMNLPFRFFYIWLMLISWLFSVWDILFSYSFIWYIKYSVCLLLFICKYISTVYLILKMAYDILHCLKKIFRPDFLYFS